MLRGDIAAILKTPLFRDGDEADITRVTAMLTSGFPDEAAIAPRWERRGDQIILHVEQDPWELCQTFTWSHLRGWYEVEWGPYALPPEYQHQGYGRRMAANALQVYNKLGISHVAAYANFDVGGYAWAKMGAAAREPKLARKMLRRRIAELYNDGNLSKNEVAQVFAVVQNAPPLTLMHRIACLVGEDGREIGRAVLLGAKWKAYWDLSDPEHKKMILGALDDAPVH